jgi:transcriptional antiterminator RfaH
MASAQRWYLIHCKPREEWRAVEHLERQSYTCYLPTLNLERLHQGRRIVTQEPLFPRYLFIQLNEIEGNWYPIRSTRGVNQIVSFNDQPVPVAEEIVEEIRTRLATQPAQVALFAPGERVQITDGAFADVEAIFLTNEGQERVVLLMNILHREQRVKVPVGSVRKLG